MNICFSLKTFNFLKFMTIIKKNLLYHKECDLFLFSPLQKLNIPIGNDSGCRPLISTVAANERFQFRGLRLEC